MSALDVTGGAGGVTAVTEDVHACGSALLATAGRVAGVLPELAALAAHPALGAGRRARPVRGRPRRRGRRRRGRRAVGAGRLGRRLRPGRRRCPPGRRGVPGGRDRCRAAGVPRRGGPRPRRSSRSPRVRRWRLRRCSPGRPWWPWRCRRRRGSWSGPRRSWPGPLPVRPAWRRGGDLDAGSATALAAGAVDTVGTRLAADASAAGARRAGAGGAAPVARARGADGAPGGRRGAGAGGVERVLAVRAAATGGVDPVPDSVPEVAALLAVAAGAAGYLRQGEVRVTPAGPPRPAPGAHDVVGLVDRLRPFAPPTAEATPAPPQSVHTGAGPGRPARRPGRPALGGLPAADADLVHRRRSAARPTAPPTCGWRAGSARTRWRRPARRWCGRACARTTPCSRWGTARAA